MKRLLIGALSASVLAGCYAQRETRREQRAEARREAREQWELNHEGQPYRRERWRDQDVWRRDDGRWYTRRNNDWVVVEGVEIR